ncbi:MAG: TPM domain-containing protein, partial [Oscillospiraceae bacterium]|nr:TPM domain-containing protein [Oscillospiraceae bacterium]
MKMRNCLLCLLAALLLFAAAVPAFAEDGLYIYDTVNLISVDEAMQLQNRAAQISERYQCGVYIVVVDNYSRYGGDVLSAAENIYRDNNFGRYRDSSGVLLLLSMNDRDYAVYHLGFGTYAANRWGESRMDSEMLEHFRANHWLDGCTAFLDTCDRMLADAENSYDPADYNLDGTPVHRRPPIVFCILVGLVVGLLVGLFAGNVSKAKMRSVHAATTAANYTAAEGLSL